MWQIRKYDTFITKYTEVSTVKIVIEDEPVFLAAYEKFQNGDKKVGKRKFLTFLSVQFKEEKKVKDCGVRFEKIKDQKLMKKFVRYGTGLDFDRSKGELTRDYNNEPARKLKRMQQKMGI